MSRTSRTAARRVAPSPDNPLEAVDCSEFSAAGLDAVAELLIELDAAEASQPKLKDPDQFIADIRKAGLDHWDKIDDPEAFIREMRE